MRRRDNPEAYVRTTMVRLHISAWRRRRREFLVAAVPDRGYTDAALTGIDERDDLWRALATVGPRLGARGPRAPYHHCCGACCRVDTLTRLKKLVVPIQITIAANSSSV